MIYSANFEELAGKISHIDVAKYLNDLGWIEFSSKREHVKIFQLDNTNDFFQVDLPVYRYLRDYNSAMFRVMECIAQSTNKSVEQVILELLNPLSDIIRLRIVEPNIETGSIFVEDAIKLYDNAKKLLTATAMDITRPQLFHVGRPDNSIIDFVNSCRFGQTEIGSYVVSIVCPISKIDNNQFIQLSLYNEEEEGAHSFTRKVVNKLVVSINDVKEAINTGMLEKIIYENADSENCISANFLDALSGICIYRSDSTLDLNIKYAPTIQQNTLKKTDVSIDHDYFSPIDTIVKKIKSVQENEKTYIGRIKGLDATPDASARDRGKITIVFINDAQNKATATVSLSKEDYNDAIEAHRFGKTVKVVGTMSGQTNKKIDYSFFEIIS